MTTTEAATLMTKSEYAEHRGVSRSMVSHWVEYQRIAIVGMKVDVEASDAMLAESLDPVRGGKDGKTNPAERVRGRPPRMVPRETTAPSSRHEFREPSDLVQASVADKNASAELKRIRASRELGRYVDADEFMGAVESALTVVRTGVMALPARMAFSIAQEFKIDSRRLIAILEVEGRAILGEMKTSVDELADRAAG